MIDLYHHGSSVCAAKVRFAPGEKQIPWQSHYVQIHKGEQFAPDRQSWPSVEQLLATTE